MLQFNKEGEKMKINEELFDYFKQVGTIKHYQKNEIIYMQDDCADELCLVLKGRVRVYHIKKNGDEINYDVLDKGRIFGESSLYENAYRPTTVSAINDVEIITCHLQDLYPYLSSSLDLPISLLKMLNDNCNHLTQLLKWAQTYNRYEKVAAFLYDLSKDNNKEKNLLFGRIPYTHQEIADSLAISRVTVTKVLNQFKEEGLIDIQYGHIQVLERQKLYNHYLAKLD